MGEQAVMYTIPDGQLDTLQTADNINTQVADSFQHNSAVDTITLPSYYDTRVLTRIKFVCNVHWCSCKQQEHEQLASFSLFVILLVNRLSLVTNSFYTIIIMFIPVSTYTQITDLDLNLH